MLADPTSPIQSIYYSHVPTTVKVSEDIKNVPARRPKGHNSNNNHGFLGVRDKQVVSESTSSKRFALLSSALHHFVGWQWHGINI